MPTLRLFANLREAAGTAAVDVEGSTVGDVIDAASDRYGEPFRRGLETAKVWVNGEPAQSATRVTADDEIAVIPPVSGGATTAVSSNLDNPALLVLVMLAGIVVANLMSLQWFTFAVVAAGIAWIWDMRDVLRARGIAAGAIAGSAAVALAANGAYGWGLSGYAGGVAAGILVVLSWFVLDGRLRSLESVAVGTTIGMVAALGAGGIVYVRIRDTGEVSFFMVVVGLAALAAWVVQRFAPDMAGVDPNLAALAVTLLAGAALGQFTDVFTLPEALLASVLIGLGSIAGRTLGSMVRWGPVMHTARAPGILTVMDVFVVSAGAFSAAVILFAS